MAIFASSVSSSSPGKDSPAMKIETVKPMPATAPRPNTIDQLVRSGSRPSPRRTAIHDARRTPTGLPTTRPAMIPSPTGAVKTSPKAPRSTPALARAKIGSTR